MPAMPAKTHYYGIIGDGHVRGKRGGAPLTIDPLQGYIINFNGLAGGAIELNLIVRGATSGAIGRVTRVTGAADVTVELYNLPAFQAGETINFDNGATATVASLLSAGQYPGLVQYNLLHNDALLNSFVPNDGVSDAPWWDRNCLVARNINIAAGFTGTVGKGDRLTTSGGAQFTVILVTAGAAGSLDLKVVRVSGTPLATETVTVTTGSGTLAGTIATVQAAYPQGTWVPFHLMPNLAGQGTYFERIPNGNGTDGGEAGIGPEVHILRQAYQKHSAAGDVADRGVRVVPFSTFDIDGPNNALNGGVTVQCVVCTGTFPTTWVIGETVTGPGGWTAIVHGFAATPKKLYVRRVNGVTLTTGTITGATSGAAATCDGAAYGFQPGSRYWNNLVAEITTATGAASSTWMSSPVQWEGVFLMIWEAELAAMAPNLSPWPTNAQMLQEWTAFIAALRTQLGNPTLPIALFHQDIRSQGSISIFGVPFAYVLRDVQKQLSNILDNVVLVSTDGMQGATQAPLPYPGSIVFLRTDDYVELGWRAWRALEFAQYIFPTSDFAPLPLILTGGQSQMVGGISSAFASLDGDPDLYSTASFPGVSTLDPAVFMWNAQDGVQAWQPFDIVMNGNTFFGMGPGTFSGVVVALALRMKRRFSETTGSAEIGFIHLGVNASSAYAGSTGALATWDPQAGERLQVSLSMTVTAQAASGVIPQRGRFTAVAGTFSSFVVGQQCNVSGGAGYLGAGGNAHPTLGASSTLYAKAGDGSWIELTSGSGNYVNEGPTTYIIRHGPYPLWPLVQNQVRAAFDKCASQLRRVPKPSLIVWWNGESDLNAVSAYHDALTRVLTGLRSIFGMRHKGEPEVPVVILQLTRRTPWGVPDADIEAMITAQQAVATELGNAVTVDTDKLPLGVGNPPVFPRTVRQHNGVHHTPRGYIMAGFLADAAAGQLVGIPAHPDGEAAVDFGADGGLIDLGTDAPAPEAGPAPAVDGGAGGAGAGGTDTTTATEAASTAAALREAIANGGDVAAYTVNGRTVQHRSLGELLTALKHFEAAEQRARGLRRTKVRFT